jgi:transcription antitermination protein NusB
MGARTSGREAALQILFAVETANHDADKAIRDFWREFPGDPEGRPFADELVRKVVEKRTELDEQIRKVSTNWRLERMSPIDRNILRLGVLELGFRDDAPRAVVIDEAVELAKRYGAENSSVFVNGVLDKVADIYRRE